MWFHVDGNGRRWRQRDGANLADLDRHLAFDHVVSAENASQRERFEALSRTLRDLLTQRWLLTQQTYERENPKQVYYLSMEFLIGRMLVNNIINLGVEDFVRSDLRSDPRQDWKELVESEPDAGLGNGGLEGRTACVPPAEVVDVDFPLICKGKPTCKKAWGRDPAGDTLKRKSWG